MSAKDYHNQFMYVEVTEGWRRNVFWDNTVL